MPTPFCPLINRYCLGSSCARWVPELASRKPPGPGSAIGFVHVRCTGPSADGGVLLVDGIGRVLADPTGMGWCADNTRTAPFKDPAVVVKGVTS